MKQQIIDIFPPEFYKNAAYWRAFTLACVYLVMAVTQLFSYEDFGEVVAGYGFAGGQVTVVVMAALLPLFEVLALPYLLSMKLSMRARRTSKIAVLCVPCLWLLVALVANVVASDGINSGLLGAAIPTMNGWWLVAFAALLLWSAVLVVRELPKRK